MTYRFENLNVWQRARQFTSSVYSLTKKFPPDEIYGLTSQVRRASISVSLNIAEGSDRKSDVEFIRFLRISIGSLNEVVTGLYIAFDLKYISQAEFELLYKESNILAAQINSLVNSLKKKQHL